MGVFSKLRKTCALVGALAVVCGSSSSRNLGVAVAQDVLQEAQQPMLMNLDALGLGAFSDHQSGEGVGLRLDEVAKQLPDLGSVAALVQQFQQANPAAFAELVDNLGVPNLVGDDGVLDQELLAEQLTRFDLADVVGDNGAAASISEITGRIEDRLSDTTGLAADYVDDVMTEVEGFNPVKIAERVQEVTGGPEEVVQRVGEVTSGLADQAQQLLDIGGELVDEVQDLVPSAASLPVQVGLVQQAQTLLPVEDLVDQAQTILSIPEGVSRQAQELLGEQLREGLEGSGEAAATVLASSEQALSGVVSDALSTVREQVGQMAAHLSATDDDDGVQEEEEEESMSSTSSEEEEEEDDGATKLAEQFRGNVEDSLREVAGELLSGRGGGGGAAAVEGLVERAQNSLVGDDRLVGLAGENAAELAASVAGELRERASQLNPLRNGLPSSMASDTVGAIIPQGLAEQTQELVDMATQEGGIAAVSALGERLSERAANEVVAGGPKIVERAQDWISAQDGGLVQDVIEAYVPEAVRSEESVREQMMELIGRARDGTGSMQEVLEEVMGGGGVGYSEALSALLQQLSGPERDTVLQTVAQELGLPAVPTSVEDAMDMVQRLSSDERSAIINRLVEESGALLRQATPVLGGVTSNLRGSDDRKAAAAATTSSATPAQVSDVLRSLLSELAVR